MTSRVAGATHGPAAKTATAGKAKAGTPTPITKAEADETTDDLLALVNAISGRVVGGDNDELKAAAAMEPGEEALARRSLSRLFQTNPVLAGIVHNAPLLMLGGVLVFWGLRVWDLRGARIRAEAGRGYSGQQNAPRPLRPQAPQVDRAAFMRPEPGTVPTRTHSGYETITPPPPLDYFPDDQQGQEIMNAVANTVRDLGMVRG